MKKVWSQAFGKVVIALLLLSSWFITGRAYLPQDDGLYPLIIVLPGFGATLENYAQYSRHFASHAAAEFNGMNPGLPHVSVAIGLDPVISGGAPCFIAPLECVKYPVAPNPLNGDIGLLDGMNAASLIFRSDPDPLTNPESQFNASLFFHGYDGEDLHAVPLPALYVDMGSARQATYDRH